MYKQPVVLTPALGPAFCLVPQYSKFVNPEKKSLVYNFFHNTSPVWCLVSEEAALWEGLPRARCH